MKSNLTQIRNRIFYVNRKARSALSIPVGFLLLDNRFDDQFIAAFPRSGSTWLRTILVNIVVPGANSNPDVFNAVISGVSIRNSVNLRKKKSPRLIMTHSCWRKSIKRAVYLVRDGRDSIISLYHYHITRNGRKETFEEFFRLYSNNVFGMQWHENVESWLGVGKQVMGENLLVVHFDEMKNETASTIRKVTQFLGISASEVESNRAIEMASIENMKTIEKKRREGEFINNASFYRGGVSGGWKEYFTEGIEQEFIKNSTIALKLCGYRI